jgi:hypothetical protein
MSENVKLVTFPMEVLEVKAPRSMKNCLEIKLETQEMNNEELAVLFSFKGRVAYAVFSEVNLAPDEIDIPDSRPEFKGDKTQSQRLRGVLYVLWEKTEKNAKTFNDFYTSKLEMMIEHFKAKIPE